MSISQDEIRDFNSPPSTTSKKNKKRNRVTSPINQSPQLQPKKSDVFELFTVKTPSRHEKSRTLPSDSQDTSELSDDVFAKPRPVSISSPSRSETKSYRDRINERFKSVKDKAGKSTKRASVFKEAAEKILLEKVKRESSDIDAELELMRERLKLGKTPERSELYEFFCGEKRPEAGEAEKEESLKSTDDKADLEFVLPKMCRAALGISEEALLFRAKAQPVDITDKIESEEPRLLEDEGFYIAPRPKISTHQLHLLEQRLSRDNKQWFNCDGQLNFVENPGQKTSYRPHLKQPPTSEISTYLPAKIEDSECEEIVVVRENLLQLQIFSLKFAHHPLFSLEHVLAEKLKKFYHDYEESLLRNEMTRLSRRLEALRHLLRRMEETSSQSGDQSDKEDDKTKAYKRDIKTLQEQVFQEGRKERDRAKSILQVWKAIKKIRETNQYSNTTVRLMIRKEKVNYEEDKENYERKLEETYDEFLEYNREKPRRKRLDEDEIKEELLERFKESFRAPGEPVLHFTLTDDNEIAKNVNNPKEQTRRNVVASTKIALKIICNKMEVCKSKWVHLKDDFTCNFDETVSIQLINVPKVIAIEVIEQPKSLIKRTVGEFTMKVPARNVASKDKKILDFEKVEIVHYKHEGVGSGVKLETLFDGLGLDGELNTSGTLIYSVAWDAPIKSDQTNSENSNVLNEIIDKTGAIDPEKLSQWMQHHKPDPQDPRNSILYEYSLDCGQEVLSPNSQNYFRLNQQMERWQFCDPKILEDNLRFKLLQLRNKNEPEFDRMMVPNRIKEIPLNILADYRRRKASEREAFSIEEDDDEDEIENKRSKGRKYLKQIHIRVFQKCKNSHNNLTYEDVVDEKMLPHLEKIIKSVVTTVITWFQWRPRKPPIPPIRITEGPKPSDYDLQGQVKVVVTVFSGLNIPTRLENKTETVSAFVEVEYNNTCVRTLTSQGAHPNWNEKLILALEPSHLDYLNPNSLNGKITLNIFDESEGALVKFGGEKCRNWLGCVEIPLSAICFDGIQGMFKVKTPNCLFGYNSNKFEDSKSPRNNTQPNQQTYLNLHVTIEPNIPKLHPVVGGDPSCYFHQKISYTHMAYTPYFPRYRVGKTKFSMEELPCADLPYIQEHALAWNEDFNTRFPNRKFSVFAIDTNATTSCIVRYIKPLEPPQINVEGFDVTPEQCARFISLIPFSDCNEFYKNIWLPVDKFLHFMIGSIIDHAVALTCYLLALKMEVWLLLGFAIPHGSTAFVLVKEYDGNQVANFYVYDVVQGKKIYLTDAFCPLQRVYCVVNEHNVWANVERSDDVATMRFDFTRRCDWLALFNNKISAPTNSIHGIVAYLPKPATEQLEIILDRKIRKKIAKLRQLDRTIWNHKVSNGFKSILQSLEKIEMYGKHQSEALEQIRKYTVTYKMRGHMFNSSFTDVNTIVKRVKSYGLHLEEDDNVQFASAVFLKAYPNQVLSVWVSVAVIKAIKDKISEDDN